MKTKELRLLIREELAKELENSSLITPINEKLDPVGKEDDDIDNDGDVDKTDKYLLNRRKAIKKASEKKDVKEGFNKTSNELYGVNYDELSPQEQEYVRDTIDMEPGGAFNPDAEQDDEDVPNPVDDEGRPLDVKEALNPEVSKTVNNLIKAIAKRYDYSEQDAVFAIMAALKQRDFDGINEEIDPRRPKDKEFDLAQQLSKLTPEDREKLAMIQQMISKEKMVKEIKPETGEKRLNDLLDIILKYVEDPDNAEEELQNYINSGYPGFSDMLKANLDRDLDFQTWVQVGHDRGLEEGEGSTLKLSAEDMEKLHKDGKLEIDGHKILYATGKPEVNEDIDLGHVDNEPHMLKADLYRIGKYSMELYKILDGFDDGETEFDFPHWWQSKIIKAKSMLVSAKHYLDFELKEPEIDAIVNVASEEEVIDEELFTPNEMGAEATERESEGPGY